jgi:hypothetical protein
MLLQLEPKIGDVLTLKYKNGERITCKVVKAKVLCQNCILYDTSINICNNIVCNKEDRFDNTQIIIIKV